MKLFVPLFVFLIMFAAPAFAAESHYGVYYFHASWRCSNCTNAEAWAGEAVDALKQANPDTVIIYEPKQLETNKQLVEATKAKRVDLVVVKVDDGKITSYANLGNLLPLVGSKQAVIQAAMDGILAFDDQVPGGKRLTRPESLAAQATNPQARR